MPKLLTKISEYFLGTETNRFYRDERNFYREFFTGKKELKSCLRDSYILEGLELFLGRAVPNFIDTVGIIDYLLNKNNPISSLLIGESIRNYMNLRMKNAKETSESFRRTIIAFNKIDSLLERMTADTERTNKRLLDYLKGMDEGEDWKKRR